MTKKFVNNIWQKDTPPDELAEYIKRYKADRKIVLSDIKVGEILTSGYFDKDEFEITKINKKTGEITVEYNGSVAGL